MVLFKFWLEMGLKFGFIIGSGYGCGCLGIRMVGRIIKANVVLTIWLMISILNMGSNQRVGLMVGHLVNRLLFITTYSAV